MPMRVIASSIRALYFVRLFMNLLLVSVLTFFVIHTILWLIRSRYDQVRKKVGRWRTKMPDLGASGS